GASDGSRSSVQPFAFTRPASSLMSCAVETQRRNPSPFLRSRPFAKSSWPSMMSQAPAFICMPRRPPFVSQRSPGVNPSTSWYQATLFLRSLTVNDAAMERSRNDSGCWRGARLGRAGFRDGRAAFFFVARFEGKPGTNPEELIAAAHAACFSMALSAGLEKAGKPAARIQTDAACTLEMVNGTPTITKMELKVRGKVPGLDQAGFQKAAEEAKSGCPVSRALKGI